MSEVTRAELAAVVDATNRAVAELAHRMQGLADQVSAALAAERAERQAAQRAPRVRRVERNDVGEVVRVVDELAGP